MPTAFDELKRAGFDGIDFPYQKCTIRCSLKEHVHEFPYTPGGQPELMGRKLYEIDFDGIFVNSAIDPHWAQLWPLQLATFRTKFEREIRSDLHIPTVGTIKAYCYDWSQLADPTQIRSGETTTWKFREDKSEQLLLLNVIKVSPRALNVQAQKVVQLTSDLGEDPSMWDEMMGAVNDVFAAIDQGELFSRLVESKILSLASICEQADRRFDLFSSPASFEVLEALKTLWANTLELAENVTSAAGKLKKYTVPHEMTTSDVAGAVFGDTSRGGDILSLNVIEDPFAIPAGTVLNYYEAS